MPSIGTGMGGEYCSCARLPSRGTREDVGGWKGGNEDVGEGSNVCVREREL
jgi:hypothetical protein